MEEVDPSLYVRLSAPDLLRLDYLNVAYGLAGVAVLDGPPTPERSLARLTLWHQAVGGAALSSIESQVIASAERGADVDLAQVLQGVAGWLLDNLPTNTVVVSTEDEHVASEARQPIAAADGQMAATDARTCAVPVVENAKDTEVSYSRWLPNQDVDMISGAIERGLRVPDQHWITPGVATYLKQYCGLEAAEYMHLGRESLEPMLVALFELYWGSEAVMSRHTDAERLLVYGSCTGGLLLTGYNNAAVGRMMELGRYSHKAIHAKRALMDQRLRTLRGDALIRVADAVGIPLAAARRQEICARQSYNTRYHGRRSVWPSL